MEKKKYDIEWVDMDIDENRVLSVAVCSYCKRVRLLTMDQKDIRKTTMTSIYIENDKCSADDHCIAFECPLNQASKNHILHTLDLWEDKELDDETASKWGCKTLSEFYIKLARIISDNYLD